MKRFFYLKLVGVKQLIYKPNLIFNHLFKDDSLYVSYDNEEAIKFYVDQWGFKNYLGSDRPGDPALSRDAELCHKRRMYACYGFYFGHSAPPWYLANFIGIGAKSQSCIENLLHQTTQEINV